MAEGLPRVADQTQPIDAFDVLVLAPVERLTTLLRRGEAVSPRGVADIQRLIHRLDALKAAFEMRTRLAPESTDEPA